MAALQALRAISWSACQKVRFKKSTSFACLFLYYAYNLRDLNRAIHLNTNKANARSNLHAKKQRDVCVCVWRDEEEEAKRKAAQSDCQVLHPYNLGSNVHDICRLQMVNKFLQTATDRHHLLCEYVRVCVCASCNHVNPFKLSKCIVRHYSLSCH